MRHEPAKRFMSLIDVKEFKENHRELYFILNVVQKLHEAVSEHDISADELDTAFWSTYPTASHDVYDGLLKDLRALDISAEVGDTILRGIEHKKLAIQLSEASFELSQGRGSIEKVQSLVELLKSPTSNATDEFETVTTSLTELIREEELIPGFSWRLKCLNLSLGPLRKGALGHIFARVETGKTAMWVSEVTHMLGQIPEGQTLCIFFNEEGGKEIIYRLYSALLKRTYGQLVAHPADAEKAFMAAGGNKIVFIDRPTLHKNEIERVCARYNPGLIVIDNIDKVAGFEADRRDLVLGAIYKWARTLAKTYAPILSVGQADTTGHNTKWLNENQMADSKTGKPAEIDFIIGIGRVESETGETVRYISIPKNKLRGDKNTDEKFRHGKFETLLLAEYSAYKDIGMLA